MRINNNITAMNAHRQYGINNNNIGKNVEKLSSGYKINRAGDDAAGLAISEKMRGQIRGLGMASKNSQDAISLVQTAEGALQETHNILQRMRELAVQSASDSNEQTIDRAALQQEFNQLQKEIDDIATKTRFNDQNLIDGTFQKNISSLNTLGTTLDNVNSLSVARAKAGDYAMSVVSKEVQESITTPGAQCQIETADVSALAGRADKIANVTFSGLNTGKHNGNVYTLQVVGGSDGAANMTFQLLDSNGDIVSTAHNVNASAWSGTGNIVNFKGVGSFTFDLEPDKVITEVTDLTSLSGAELKFMEEGYTHTVEMTGGTLNDITSAINDVAADGSGAIKIDYVAPATDLSVVSSSGTAPEFTFDYAVSKNGTLTVKMMQDGNMIKSGSVNLRDVNGTDTLTIDFGEYGKVEVGADKQMLFDGTFDLSFDASEVNLGTQTDISGAVEKAVVTFNAANSGIIVGTSGDAEAEFADLYEYTCKVDALGNATYSVYDKSKGGMNGGKEALITSATENIVGIANSNTKDIDLGKFGKFTITATGGATALAASPAAVAEVAIAAGNSAISAESITQKTMDPLAIDFEGVNGEAIDSDTTKTVFGDVGGETPETTTATRASMILTINGESINLYKGDTYANFSDQGIAFNFNALSDDDIANAEYFGANLVNIAVNNTNGKELIIQTGANQGDELGINIDRMNTEQLGISYSNIATREAASQAITEVNDALNQVSTQRAALGALQNRLDHKIANLDTSAENLQAAESRIRDVDMAKQMTQFMRDQILSQASTAMLAQANALPQGVLQLLG